MKSSVALLLAILPALASGLTANPAHPANKALAPNAVTESVAAGETPAEKKAPIIASRDLPPGLPSSSGSKGVAKGQTRLRAQRLNTAKPAEAKPFDVVDEVENVEHAVGDAAANVVAGMGSIKWWGRPQYESYLKSWDELVEEQGVKGRMCELHSAKEQCGHMFVCRSGHCGECRKSKECHEKYACMSQQELGAHSGNLCVARDLLLHWGWGETLCTVLVIITAVLSAAAGMGGGGVFVPLFLLLLGLSAKEAVPLSQALIVGGATVNILMFCGERHPKYPERPRIDYDVIMMLNPGLAIGVTVGVIAHIISPQWLIVCVLIVTLVISGEKSLTKGIAAWKKESKALEEQEAARRNSGAPPGGGGGGGGENIKMRFAGDYVAAAQLMRSNARKVGLIVGCWIAFFVLNVTKAAHGTTMYWVQLAGMMAIACAFTYWAAAIVSAEQKGQSAQEGVLQWTPKTLWLYPLFSIGAGFLGGFLGIGGGIIMGPMLLELGMVPEANQATTAMFVLLSSSLATVQFILLGAELPQYVAWFATWVILSTFVGQTAIDYLLKKYKRSSVIVLSIAAIILGSLVMMTITGGLDIYDDWMMGVPMGFAPHKFYSHFF